MYIHNLHNLHTLFFDRRLIEANEAATNDVHQPSSAPFVHKRSYISPFSKFTSGLKGHQSSLELGHVSGCSFWPYQWLTNSTYISVKLHLIHLVECARLALKLLKLRSWNSRAAASKDYYHPSKSNLLITGTSPSTLSSFLWTLSPPTNASNNHHYSPLFESINNELPFGSPNSHFSDSKWNPASILILLVALLPRRILHYLATPQSLVLNHRRQLHPKIALMRPPVYQIKQVSLLVPRRNPQKCGKP